jgi:hypothetical protein
MAIIFEQLILSLLAFSSAFLISLYFYFTRNFNFWKNLGVPYIKPLPFVGSVKDVMFQKESMGKYLQKIYDNHSDKPYVGIFAFDQPILVIRDLDLVKNILVKDAQSFIDHTTSLDKEVEPLLAKTMFVLKGQLWCQVRVKLTPVFTSAKMKMMFYLVEICGKELVEYLDVVTADGK